MAEWVAEPEGLLAARLTEAVTAGGMVFLARSEARAGRLARAAAALAPGLRVVLLPGWDCLPYDRASPSRQSMGLRMAALRALSDKAGGPVLLFASVEAATQRLPPPAALAELTLRAGGPFDEATVSRRLEQLGFVLDDRVDEPGEATLHGSVLDVFPPGDGVLPCRVEHEDGRILSIRHYDPLTQRSVDQPESSLTLGPASEAVWPEDSEDRHAPGIEHALPDLYPGLVSLFDLMPGAPVLADPEVEELRAQRGAEVADAFRTRFSFGQPAPDARPAPEPARLYLDDTAWAAALAGREVTVLKEAPEDPKGTIPRFVAMREPEEAFLAFLAEQLDAGCRVALSGRDRQRTRALARLVRERMGLDAEDFADWAAVKAAPAGRFGVMRRQLDTGFSDGTAVVVAPDDVRVGPRLHESFRRELPGLGDTALQPGDAVIHLDHGLGALRGVETVMVDEVPMDCLALEYAGNTKQLVPLDEMDRVWRYGAEAEGVTLDRLGSRSWPKRRAEVEAQVAESARALCRMAEERAARRAPVLRAPARAYDRFAARFPFALTPDQADGIDAVLADLASGTPMNRLVCGDVGFGKTEVALRAAAVAALAGKQVAVLAPTTVLVRQHLNTFRRRFAGMTLGGRPIRIEQLSRLSSSAEARAVKAGLADGAVRIVIGTQALAARDVRFAELGLVVVDEEQRFGARQKAALRKLGENLHHLAMTATPIPRTLQSALVGLEDLSIIATPPGRRQPIRTLHVPLDDMVLHQALSREKRRGGQSFVVCSRIEDLPEMRARIEAAVPELSIIEAHGGLPADEVDTALLRFAEGDGDVLLSTNIVETGLDVPRANTMLVHRADRFGIGQLHQLRGRVGRGRVRGSIVLLTDPADPPSELTRKRLKTLEAFDRIGAGFAISARDMDLRGAGDLLGETQAGHMKLIGLEFYQHMLQGALRQARGEAVREDWTPALCIAVPAGIPRDYVEEEATRVELHARLAAIQRRGDAVALGDFAEEVDDRFGTPPEEVASLLALARLRINCRRLGIAELKVGPSAATARFRGRMPEAEAPLERRGDRLRLARESHDAAGLLITAKLLVNALAKQRRARRQASPAEQRVPA